MCIRDRCVCLREMLGKLVKKISIGENVLAAIVSSAVLFLTKQILTNGTSVMQVFVNLVITAVVFFGVYGVVLLVQKEKFAVEMMEMGIGILRRKK